MLTSRFGSGFAGVRENRIENAVAAARVWGGGVSMGLGHISAHKALFFLRVVIPPPFITAETLMRP
jgi:hypothetical protein